VRFVGLILFCTLAACAPAQDESDTAPDELIGGAAGEPVASIRLENGCTATRVGEQHILTAAHCVLADGRVHDIFNVGAQFKYDTGWHLEGPARRSAHVMQLIFGEQYAVDRTGPDWALIVTREGLGDLPRAMVDLDPVNAGDQVLLSGYGCTQRFEHTPRSAFDFGIGYSFVTSIDDSFVYTSGPAAGGFAGLCPGDSGGPLYRHGAVVGVNAWAWWADASRVPTKNGHTRLDGATATSQRLAQAGVQVCRSSQGTCVGREPQWVSGKLTLFDKCIAPRDGRTENGTPLVMVPCNGERNQRWVGRPDRTFVHETSGKCFDMAAPEAGAPMHLWDCHRGRNQLFSQGNGGTLRVDTGFCADAWTGSSEDGTPIVGWTCHGERNQQIGYWF